jgi:drug/metabolite transporter (DMT)-like permease
MNTIGLIVASVVLSGGGQLLLKHGTMSAPTGADPLSVRLWLAFGTNPAVLLGLGAWAVSTMLWLVVLSRTDLSFAYVLGSINYIVIPLISRFLFNERIGDLRLVGMGVIFVGVVLTLYGRISEQSGP